MFAGLLGLQCNGNGMESGRSLLHHFEVMEGGGKASASAGEPCRKRPQRRPGYMRADLLRPQSAAAGDEEDEEEEEEEAEGRNAQARNGGPGVPVRKGQSSIIDSPNTPCESPVLTPQESLLDLGRQPEVESHTSWLVPRPTLSLPHPPEPVGRSCGKGAVHHQGGSGQSGTPGPAPTRHVPAETRQTTGDSFNSSFSFIQQSLSANRGKDIAGAPLPVPRPPHRSALLQQSAAIQAPAALCATQTKPRMLPASGRPLPKLLIPVPTPGVHSQREEVLRQGGQWGCRVELPPNLPGGDSFSLGTEFPSSLSVDSDTASSVTSGYESATPASDQSWDHLVRKCEGVLRECLQNNRANTKIESMMLKLQRLQQKAILDDDYDTAERFGQKLGELCRERSALKLGLPSRQPGVASFLQRLTQAVNSALQRTEHCQRRESSEPGAGERSSSQLLNPRDLLVQEKHLVEAEMVELQRRLTVLQERRGRLEEQLQQREEEEEEEEEEEQRISEDLEGSVLRGRSAAQLSDISRALRDLVTSECRMHIAVTPSPSVLRLQEQEKALNLSVKEATTKVVTSQRLGGSLRRKVSETETQLLALHEAKVAAISGNDFGSAKELKAEMKTVYQERDRLERLARRLQHLSWGNSQELARMKEQQQQLRVELEQREALHESLLKENAAKYIELLEDRLHSCGCPPLEKVWEADLEACQLFLRGPQLRTPSYSGPDSEEPPSAANNDPLSSFAQMPTSTKEEEEEEDCAMLTALGGRWCPEANLQHSEFTKKLEEFLFCMEDSHTEEECGGGAGAGELTEQCDMISDRLMTLEDDMQMAILSRDHALTQSLAKEVQEVKATLQAMLAQLKEEEEEEEEEEVEEEKERHRTAMHDCDLMENGIEVEEDEEKDDEEEEDQYFSDSWDI